MAIIGRKDGKYIVTRDDGTTVELTCNEASLLINFCGKENLRQQIEDRIADAEEDWLDMGKYPYTREEFVDEIFVDLEDEVDCGNSVDDDDIDDKIADLASYYEMDKED